MNKLRFSIIVLLFSGAIIQAQDAKEDKNSKEQKLYIKVKEEAKPTIYIDGKKFEFPMELIDQSKIESMSVLKGDAALKMYNEPNGVILITTKITKKIEALGEKVFSKKYSFSEESKPMVILDGKVVSEEIIKSISPDTIKSVDILKGAKALEKYNAPNGAIIITTKKM